MGLNTRRQLTALLIFAMFLFAFLFAFVTPVEAQGRGQRPEKTTLILKMASGVSQAEGQATARRHGGTPKSSIAQLGMIVVEVPTEAADSVRKHLQEDPAVARVDENYTRKLSATPSDSLYESQWALPKIAWDQVYGTVLPIGHADVAILDTGIDAAHPDLIGAIGPGTSMIDGSEGRTDENGHGSWVAGIVAARTNNLDGIAGVGYSNVQVLPVKVLDADGLGQDSDIIAGILWAVDHNASVILMAFSNPGFSANLQDAIDYAWSRGVVLVAAAGNDASNTATFPAGDQSVIGVSATDPNDALASTSNFGPSIFMAAPGVDIVSTYKNGGYVAWSGSSASAAFVAGAAAFMRAVDPSLTNGAVVGRLARNADPAGTQEETGNGRLQLARALADTSTEEVQPVGAPPVGDGGPFVGPYRIAALNAVSIGSASPASVLYGTGNPITYAINLTGTGNTKRNLTVNWAAPGAPAGVTTSTSVANPDANCNLNSGTCNFTLTITPSTTTPVVTRNFTVTVNGVLSSGSATFTVTPKPASVTPNAASKTYGDADPALTGTLSGFVAADGVTASYARIAGETVPGSPYTISATLSPVGVLPNYAITYNTANFTIDKAPSVTTVTCPPSVTYTGAALTPCTTSVTGAGGLNLAPTPTYANNTNAGTATASYNYPGDDNHTASGDSKDFAINKADATITVNGYTGVYDGDAHGATGSATGVNSEDLSGLLDLGASFTNVPGGTANWTFAGNVNYNAANGTASIVITKADATITVNGYTGVYDGNAHGATGSATGVSSEDLSGLLDLGASFTNVPGGTANWTFAGNGNYNAANGTASIVITKADATITVNGYTGVYDGNAHGATGSAAGVNSEDLSGLLDLGASFTNVPGGTANWTFAGNGNYNSANGTASIVITKADANITVNGYTGVYDGNAHGATGSASGVNSEDLSGLLDLGASFTNVPGGTTNWTFAGNGNYNAANGTASIVITKADATITVNGYTGVYDGDAHGATGSATGVSSEDLSGLLDLGASFTNVPGGTANWSFAGNGNYNAANGTGSIVITKADATITVNEYTGVYDGNAHGATGSATGVSSEDLSGLLDLGASFTNVPGGTANWSFAGNGNYNAANGTASIVITKADAAITVNGYTGVYDGNAHGATGSATGVSSEDLSGLLDLGALFTNVPGGTANWSFAGNGNYNSANGTASIVITKADAAITVNGYTGVYDGNAHGATGSATGVNGENLSGLLDLGASFTNVPGGTANWTFAGNGNYNSANGTASIVITKADATIAVNGYTGVYDGNAHGATGSALGVDSEDLSSLLDLGASFTNVPGGTANWTFAGNGNYNAANGTASIVITKADATITVNGYTGVYDGNAHGATGSASGVNSEDLSSLLDPGASFTNVPGGTANWTFAGNGNYNSANGTASIVLTKADATITVNGYTGVYDGNAHGATGSASGVNSEDLSSLLDLGASFTNVPGGTANWTFAGNSNYNAANGDALITITARPLTVNAVGVNKVYDGNTGASVTFTDDRLAGDDLTFSYTASFDNKNVGTGKPVSVSGIAISGGADQNNYSLSNTTSETTANITALAITGSITAADKVYDGTTAATITSRTLLGVIGTDDVSYAGGTATFNNKNVGTGKPVNATGLNLSGADAGNYTVNSIAATTAAITKLDITGSITAADRVYNGTTAAVITSRTLAGVLGSDDVSYVGGTATFDNKNVGTDKTVTGTGLSLSGADADNYSVNSTAQTEADITPLAITGSFNASDKVYDGTTDAAITGLSLTGVLSGDDVSLTGGTATFADPNVGTWTVTGTGFSLSGGDAGNYSLTSVNTTTATITVASTTATLTVTGPVQYSDQSTFTVSLSPDQILGVSPATGVQFKIDGVNVNTVQTLGDSGASLTATITTPILLAPGNHVITAVFQGVNSNFTVSMATATLLVNQEDARTAYTGLIYVTTASTSSSTATVILSATIQDITAALPASDAYPGDIRNAKVSFINRDTGAVIASNLTVTLINPADTKTGTVSYAWSVNIGSADSATVTVGVKVDNWYTRNDSSENTLITVKKPTAGSIGGGGWLTTGGQRTNFGLNVKFNKSGSNLQGNVNIIFRRLEGTVLKVYQIKSNAVDSLNILNPSSGVYTATFTSKANLTDITNPVNPIPMGGNRILQITMTDRGEPGAADTIGITLDGGATFSSNWNGAMTIEQLLGGGNLQVRP